MLNILNTTLKCGVRLQSRSKGPFSHTFLDGCRGILRPIPTSKAFLANRPEQRSARGHMRPTRHLNVALEYFLGSLNKIIGL